MQYILVIFFPLPQLPPNSPPPPYSPNFMFALSNNNKNIKQKPPKNKVKTN